jgi:hypothetical protein
MVISPRSCRPLGVAALLATAACSDSIAPVAPKSPARQALFDNAITVETTLELLAALSSANAGRRIVLRAGTYDIDHPLTVPDSVTLEGEGTMLFDAGGLPTGFGVDPHAALRMTANVPGDMLTLGNGATIRKLQLVDLAGRNGNVVGVASRAPYDELAASIRESEMVPSGATFYGLSVQTRNLNPGAASSSHDGASISVQLTQSLVRSPGRGLFAFNFASRGKVVVALHGNVLGTMVANGGVSLPDAVHDSEVQIVSRGNLYRRMAANPCTVPAPAWNLTGGSGPNSPVPVSATVRNTLRVHSLNDRIQGFTTAILGIGGRRFFGPLVAGASSDNKLELELIDATLSTPSCGGAEFVRDLDLQGARSDVDGLAPGDDNRLHAVIRGVTGSGLRFNNYANAAGPSSELPPGSAGTGNRLDIAGNVDAFSRTNYLIDPVPPRIFFAGNAH